MDEDLKQHIDDAFTRFSQHILHEMSVRFSEVDTKLTSIDAPAETAGWAIQSGARAMARFEGFSEHSEERWIALVARVEALERKLENEAGKG